MKNIFKNFCYLLYLFVIYLFGNFHFHIIVLRCIISNLYYFGMLYFLEVFYIF